MEPAVTSLPEVPPVNRVRSMILGIASMAVGAALASALLPAKVREVTTVQTVPVEVIVEAKPTAISAAPKPESINAAKFELAPMPREVEVVAQPPMPPLPAVALPGGVSLIRLDRPTEIYTMERIGEGNYVKLTGRVQKLVISGVNGGATLNITELDTKYISFNGRIEGNATIKVNMPGSTLSFSKAIAGGAKIEANVHDGNIGFSMPGGTVSGGARLRLTGKSVWFHNRIDGGSQIEVTVSNSGSLRFLELAEGSKIHYRGDKPDAEFKISPGRIDESSECKRLD